jgi:hypothetical protein
VPEYIENGVAILQYADDTILCLQDDKEQAVNHCGTNNERGMAKWDWEKASTFSVKSTYKHLCKNDYGPNFKNIWKAKMPLKVKIFMWLVL